MKAEPITVYGKRIREGLSAELWSGRVRRAHERVAIVEAVLADAEAAGAPVSRESLRRHAPTVHWSTFRHWLRSYQSREGPEWERLLDRRLMPAPWTCPAEWRVAIKAAYCHDPAGSYDSLRKTLQLLYGEEATLGDNTIRRILQEAGLWKPRPRSGPVEKVTELHGGGGLALILAAELATGAVRSIAEAALSWARSQESGGGMARPEDDVRDDRGRFTGEYNALRQERYESAGIDPFFHSVAAVRGERDLGDLQLSRMGLDTLWARLRVITVLPLVTERRGVAGLDGPMGGWLEAFSSYAYKAASAEKTLSELKLLEAGGAMWDAHATTWGRVVSRWSGEDGWRQCVAYVDATTDPYWTERFTASGKVARTGRVQPCLSRVSLSAGPGVPIFMEVVSGTVKLKDHLLELLRRADGLLGPGELGRVTVVDAECGNAAMLQAFASWPERDLVTVLKGSQRQGKTLQDAGPWLDFRERDRVREARAVLANGLSVRVVEMERVGSRHPTTTWFATTAGEEMLPTKDVAEIYLSRWPSQEDLFRRGRDGAGLERSHGYGVAKTQNVAVLTRREKADAKVQRWNVELRGAISSHISAQLAVEDTKARLVERKTEGEDLDGRNKLGLRQASARLKDAGKRVRAVERDRAEALREQRKQQTMPDEIYVRDTALDSVTTCLKMTLLALLEYVCQEYLGGRRITPRTFAEAFVALPVRIRERRHEVIYEVEPNPRNPEMMALLEGAIERINQQKLRHGKRRIVVRMQSGPG
ncbi:MAG: hypothetical protein ABIK09_04930 [Pseudomonadota bacterium]